MTYRKLRQEDLTREFFDLLAQLTVSPYPPDLCESESDAKKALDVINETF